MNIRTMTLSAIAALTLSLAVCSSNPTNAQIGTGVGAVAGGVVGNAVLGAPRVVLSGGRYDPLMRRFGKEGDAIGFALYLDELTRVLGDHRVWDADVLALYCEGDDLAQVNAAVFAMARGGLRAKGPIVS